MIAISLVLYPKVIKFLVMTPVKDLKISPTRQKWEIVEDQICLCLFFCKYTFATIVV